MTEMTAPRTIPLAQPPGVPFDPAVLAYAAAATLGQIDAVRRGGQPYTVRGDLSTAAYLDSTAGVLLSETADQLMLLLDVLRDDLGVVAS